MTVKQKDDAIDRIEKMRNLLAFMLVASFVTGGGLMFNFVIPEANKEIVTYMVGQLSGMATMALGFYYVGKVGQDALDATRAVNTGKMADAVTSALQTGAKGTEEDPLVIEGSPDMVPVKTKEKAK